MSGDIFANPVVGPPRTNFGFATDPDDEPPSRGSCTLVPRDPDMERLNDWRNAVEDIERARKEAEMDTPQNRQKAAEEKMAERERKRVNFDFGRAMVDDLEDGWMQLRGEFEEEEIRVYTTDYSQRRFWGIKPAGMGMYDFWEQNDPDVTRYDDNIAITWENPLVAPPVIENDEPVIWVGKGPNPDLHSLKAPKAKASPHSKPNNSKRHRKSPEINPTHRVRKAATASSNVDKKRTRKPLPDMKNARRLRALEDQLQEQEKTALVSNRPSRNQPAAAPSEAPHNSTTKIHASAPPKRARGRPSNTANPVPQEPILPTPKRPRGRPAKDKSAASTTGDASLPKRPRGRPPGSGKSPAVQGNARITKPSQRAPAAPSKHQMRTRNKGAAELLRLPY